MRAMIPGWLTRDVVLDAIDRSYDGIGGIRHWVRLCYQLKWAYLNRPDIVLWPSSEDDHRIYHEVQRMLTEMGGSMNDHAYFWPLNEDGHSQRMIFLAFLLTWLDAKEFGR